MQRGRSENAAKKTDREEATTVGAAKTGAPYFPEKANAKPDLPS